MSHRDKGWPKSSRKNKEWTSAEVNKLKKLAKSNTPTGLISDSMRRTEDAIRSKASEERVSLKPTNQSPYNRRKK